MKQEKRMKQFYEELKLKQMKSPDTPSLSVERMREAQARMKTPYLVLSGHVKPGYVFNLHKLFLSEKKLRNLLILEVLGEIK
jgi:U4/U6.U5 tri-snRNP-associated protein 1